MLQIIVGIVLGLILVAFFIAAMYAILPDEAVDKALNFFEDLRNDLLNNTIGRILEILLLPITQLSNLLIKFTLNISARGGPLAGFGIALLGIIRSSRGLITIISPEKAGESVDALYKATVILLVITALGAISRVVRNALKSLFCLPILLIIRSKRGTKRKIHINKRTAIRIAYIVVIILAILLGVHAIATAVEVIRPNSRPAELFKELDLLEKFYLYAIKDIEIR